MSVSDERVSGEGVNLSLSINESTPKKSFAVLNGDHGAGRPGGTRHYHRDAGFSLGEGRRDRRQTDRTE